MTITDKQVEAALVHFAKGNHPGSATPEDRMRAALEAADAAAWEAIATAPTNGVVVMVYAAPREGLPGFITNAAYHPDAGWCVDELRYATHWRPIPASQKGE